LEKDEIRLHYSGFIVFAAQMLSLGTGLVFTLLLTRNMTKDEYGVWANIFDVISYFLLFSGVFPFWTMRFVARQKKGVVKTGFLANLVLSLVSMVVYISLIPFVTTALNISTEYLIVYFIASAQIVNMFLIAEMESILRAKKPQAIGYGLLLEESCKIALAYLLIVRLQQLLLGALLSLMIAAAVQVIYYVKLTFQDMKEKIQWTYAKDWLRYSTSNIYNAVGNQLAAFPLILLFRFGEEAARANYQAALTFANIIGYSLFLSYALYPRLLTRNSLDEVAETFRTVFMFAVLMLTITLSIPQSLLTILNVNFGEVTPVLLFLAVDAFVVLIIQFYSSVIFGVERFDEESRRPFRMLLKSKIFKVFTLPYIQSIISIPACLYVLTQYAIAAPLQAALYVTVINLASHVMTLIFEYAMMHDSVRINVPWNNITKCIFASVVSGGFLYVLPRTTTILLTLAVVLIGVAIYFLILLAIDKDARRIANAIWNELKSIIQR
jgi:O-antigen/teichoic acid export membrane protein